MVAGVSRLATLPVSLPSISLPKGVGTLEIARYFRDFLSRSDDANTFVHEAVWRDTFALTGTFRTFYSAEGIAKAWQSASAKSSTPEVGSLVLKEDAAKVTSLPNGSCWVDISGSFKVSTTSGLIGRCTLMISVVPDPTGSDWKIWSMRTILEGIEGWSSVDYYTPQRCNEDTVHEHLNGRINSGVTNGEIRHFDVVVIGGGQAGLSTAGRLQALGIDYIIVDSYKTIGDSWASRYDSARLHTPREYAHLPFNRTFPEGRYQEFLTKDELARGYQDWSEEYDIVRHVWTETILKSGIWDDPSHCWTLQIDHKGSQKQVRCRFVVMATGAGGQVPWMPDLLGKDDFEGIILHSQDYKSSTAWKGKRGIVVGTANTAHDIADDMYEAGLTSVTMIQRSKTYVMPYEYWQTIASRIYNANMPTEDADRLQMTGPNAVGRLMAKGGLDATARREPERFDALESAGFMTERYGDIFWHLMERAGGHYMDVGTSKKIADGKIKVKAGVPITHCTATGLRFGDGTEIFADVIVFATGFEIDMKQSIRKLFGNEVANKTDQFFGVDDEGEVRGAWRLQHPGLISHGIAQGQARYLSRFIALQIKAVLDNKSFTPYLDTPVPPSHIQREVNA